MDLLSLRYFQAVARCEHISRAAAELRVSQPSLSRSIARLEAHLGVPLFDRDGRRVRLNRFGAAFLRRVDRALGELDDARRELADAAGLAHGSVAVASETLLTLTGVLTGFRAEYPGVDIRAYQAGAEAMLELLRHNQVDFALASQPLEDPAVSSTELLTEPVLLAVAPTHRLARREHVTVAELADEPLVTTRPGSWPRELIERLFTREGLSPRIVCEGDELASTEYMISLGLGVGLAPAMGQRPDSPVSWVRLDAPDCQRTLRLAWRHDAYHSSAAQRFRTHAIQHFSRRTREEPAATTTAE